MNPKRSQRNDTCRRCGKKLKLCRCRKRGNRLSWVAIIVIIGGLLTVWAWHQLTQPAKVLVNDFPRQQFDGTDSLTIARCMDTMRYLVQSHPDTIVSQWADREIQSMRLYLNYQDQRAVGASAFAVFQVMNVQDIGLTPVMSIGATGLLDPQMPNWEKQLVIRHEIEHYRQFLKKSFPPETYFLRNLTVPFTPYEIRNLIIAESEAYEVEGQLAKRMGRRPDFPIVLGYLDDGYPGLIKALVEHYSQLPPIAPHRRIMKSVADSLIAARQN